MADQRRWFKVWGSIGQDPAFLSLPLEALGRWTLLGAWMAVHGTKGRLHASAAGIRHILRIAQDVPLNGTLKCLPGVSFEEGKKDNDEIVVIMQNWQKYQHDSSVYERVKRLRSKRRREEKRGEEKKDPPTQVVKAPQLGSSEWPEEWTPIADRVTTLPFLAKYRTWLADLQWWVTLDELFTSCPKPLDGLLLEAVAYCESEGYVPRSKAGIRKKLKNCMEFAARRAEREAQERKR